MDNATTKINLLKQCAQFIAFVVMAVFIAACSESDEDDGEFRTLLITLENTEPAMLAVSQAGLFPLIDLPIFESYDPNNFDSLSGEQLCLIEGRIIYSYSGFQIDDSSFNDGRLYVGSVGDSFRVEYDGCNDGEKILDGTVHGTLKSWTGNFYFRELVSAGDPCLIFELEQEAEFIRVETEKNRNFDPLDPDDMADFVARCSKFTRVYDVSVSDLSVFQGNSWSTLSGSFAVEQATNDGIVFSSQVQDEDITVRVRLGGTIVSELQPDGSYVLSQEGGQNDRYSLSRIDLTYSEDIGLDVYRLDISGRMSSSKKLTVETKNSYSADEVLGTVEFLTSSNGIRGTSVDEFPIAGALNLRGAARTSANFVVSEGVLATSVDFNGDGNGDGFAEVDETFDTTWIDLVNNNFIFAD